LETLSSRRNHRRSLELRGKLLPTRLHCNGNSNGNAKR
jgi:hypothetical protein